MLIPTLPEGNIPITVDAWKLKAATIFQGKGDIRFYLNGICLLADGRICGTDGHRLFVADCGFKLPENRIICISGSIPNRDVAEIRFYGKDTGVIKLFNRWRSPKEEYRAFSVIDGKYPDIDKVLQLDEPQATSAYGIDATYLASVAKAFSPHRGIKVETFKENGPLRFTSDSCERESGEIIIMQRRLAS